MSPRPPVSGRALAGARRGSPASVASVVTATTRLIMLIMPSVTSVVMMKKSVPAGIIRMVSQASPERHVMSAAVTMPMHGMPLDRIATLAAAVTVPQGALAVAIEELGQVVSPDKGRDECEGFVARVDSRAVMRTRVTVPRRCGSRAQQRDREESDQG